MRAREAPMTPPRTVSLSRLSRALVRKICSFSSLTFFSSPRRRTVYAPESAGRRPRRAGSAGAPAGEGAARRARGSVGGRSRAGRSRAARRRRRRWRVSRRACVASKAGNNITEPPTRNPGPERCHVVTPSGVEGA